ncbi:hypothetical protein C1I95_21755 [Micromonospora craterilacus]|uniref:Uncharacterized protein n=1 Tax=Micromonospora craterilacus TaxID=1655439 RepID=A0A2W2ELG8_9ACTN|nr:hypothetical protein [Micromonospora craterilacus]PZG14420.1 hypothetical protein C1I95_21755 [Micromonospora craterilacus]
MARADVVTQRVTRAGLEPELTSATADGDVVDTGQVALWVVNGGESPITVTVVATATQDGLAVANLARSVPAGGQQLIGPLPARTFAIPVGEPDAGRAHVDYSAVVDVDRAVISL